MEEVDHLRNRALLLSGILCLIGAVSLWPWSAAAAQGLLLGVLAGGAGFYVQARHVKRLALGDAKSLQYATYFLWSGRMSLYALALWIALRLESERAYGLWTAAAGLVLVQFAVAAVGAFTFGSGLAPSEDAAERSTLEMGASERPMKKVDTSDEI